MHIYVSNVFKKENIKVIDLVYFQIMQDGAKYTVDVEITNI